MREKKTENHAFKKEISCRNKQGLKKVLFYINKEKFLMRQKFSNQKLKIKPKDK